MHNTVSLFRRLAALLYDSILILAIMLISSAILLIFTHGKAITPDNHYYQFFLLCICYLFFVSFWLKGGQTTGMMAWKIFLFDQENKTISFKQANLRILFAVPSISFVGIGLIWSLFNKNKLSLYDLLSKTRLFYLP